jgi:MFS family permease
MTADGTKAPDGTRHQPMPGARSALALLIAINLFNYIDRQVLAAVQPHIERNLFPVQAVVGASSLGLMASPSGQGPLLAASALFPDRSHLPPGNPNVGFWMGTLLTAFMVTYMLAAPLFGWLADRTSRWLLIGVGVILWSLASGASGLPWPVGLGGAFWLLLLTRCFVGVGEGAYGPVAPAMISDLYPVRMRGQVLAWFYAAIPVGSALGYTLGGQVAATPGLGWRWAFYLVVPPGILLGLLCFFMREPARGQADPGAHVRRAGWRDYRRLLRIPSYVLGTLGMTAMTFALGGLGYWMSTYLEERQARGELTWLAVPGLGRVEGVTLFGGLLALSGLLATLGGGIAGDRLRTRLPGSYFLVSGVAMLLAGPLILLVLWTTFPLAWVWLFLAAFCLFFNTGPTNTILANVTHPSIRASGFAFNILIIHLFGDAVSPAIMGFIRDRSNLDTAFLLVTALILIGGILWLWGTRYLERDTVRAPTLLDRPGGADTV